MSNVPDRLKHLENLTPAEIEARCLDAEKRKPEELTDDILEEVVALMAIHRRKTAGPAKPKSDKPAKPNVTLADFFS